MTKTFLMVTHGFPPKGGGGIQRNVKFLKYLGQKGWKTQVLTVAETDFYVFDETMLEELGATEVVRAESVDPLSLSAKLKRWLRPFRKSKNKDSISVATEGAWYVSVYRKIRDWVLIPDACAGWIPFALYSGRKLISRDRPDIIFCSFPSASNAIVGYYLSRWFGIPMCIDFRDAWQDDPYVKYPSRFHKWYHARWEKKVLNKAVFASVYGGALKAILEERYPHLEGRISVITNGFDPDDFRNLEPQKGTSGKRRLVYSGAVYVDRRETFTSFVNALSLLPQEKLELLEIVFVGVSHNWANEIIQNAGLDSIVTFTGYKSHKQALEYLVGGDAALLFLAKGDVVALTGKVFEYLGSGLPVIACVEKDGACAALLAEAGLEQGVCSPTNTNEIKEVLLRFIENRLPSSTTESLEQYSRKHHTDLLAELICQNT